MRILITGGAGYIGTEVTRTLCERDFVEEVVVYDNLSRGNYNLFIGSTKLPPKVKFRQADVLDTRTLRQELDGIDTVLHLAAKVTTPFADQNPHAFEQINHWGTAELVYAVEDSSVKSMFLLSSASVYGASSEEVHWHSATDPKTFYGISKLRGEQHAQRLLDDGFPMFIIRCGNVFGFSESMRFDSVINRFIFEANFFNKIAIRGSGNQHRSFVHIDRVSNTLTNVIHSELAPGIYNLVEATYSVNDVAERLGSIYPDLDMIFLDQIMKMRELKVKRDERIDKYCDLPNQPLVEQLKSFRNSLTF